MNSFAALSKAYGLIFHLTLKDLMLTMRHIKSSIPLIAMAGVFAASPASQAQEPSDAQLATVKQYCSGCHNDKAKIAGVTFQGITADSIAKDPELFEKAVRKLRGRVMPPPGARQPDGKAVDSLVAWLEDSLDKLPTPQHVTDSQVLHRLNRKEYENAVHDLLLVDVKGAELLPPDDSAQGFDNIASALQVSPSFIEQYVLAAHTVAVTALGRHDIRPQGWTFRAASGNQLTHVPGLPLGTRGGILAKVDLPADGQYKINIADMAFGLWGSGLEYENPLVVTIDNKVVYQTVVGGQEDTKLFDQVQNGALDRVNARLKNIKFEATAGPHNIGVTFRRQSFAESDDQLQMFAPGGGQDRSYRVSSFQLLGPFDVTGLSSTPSRDRIFTCNPAKDKNQNNKTMPPEACAKQIFSTLARRAYRRPVTNDDIAELMQYYADGAKDGFESGIRSGITGMLASPFFLYRAERIPAALKPGDKYEITDLELASKLSFFLWNSIPDDQLLDLASKNKLSDPATLANQVRRMLADPRSKTLASDFVFQWLEMKKLDEIVPDRDVFPYASGFMDPRQDFRTELTLFSDSIFREDRSVVDLLRSSHTYVNERLALQYGLTDVKGDEFRRVELKDSARWGLLGKGAVLMAAAYPNRTSPVLRGKFILSYIEGVPPPNPPPNVPTLNDKDIGTTKALTVRELMAKHRASPTCSSCHSIMDPLGFALENFDATGMWRDKDRFAGTVIDSAGELPDGTKINGPDDLRNALLRRPEQFVQTFVEALLTYSMGRTREYYDMPTVRKIVRDTRGADYKFSAIVEAVVNTDQFKMRRVPPPEPVQSASSSQGAVASVVGGSKVSTQDATASVVGGSKLR
jgi:mono/diheme cytochrome c family protein